VSRAPRVLLAPGPGIAALLGLTLLVGCRKASTGAPGEPRDPERTHTSEIAGFTFLRHGTFSCGGATHRVAIYPCEALARATGLPPEGTAVDVEFVLVPAGTFQMGSARGSGDEIPVRRVTLARPFLLARTAVTERVWRGLAPDAGVPPTPSGTRGDLLPVERVSWITATTWCQAAGLRLPSEAEWEYACRAGTTSAFAFGSTITPSQVNYNASLPQERASPGLYRARTLPVGTLPPNAFGMHEMHGNVWEWCQDAYGSYADAPDDGTPAMGSGQRILRGGCWRDPASDCRSAYRYKEDPDLRHDYISLRPARSVP
jgi:formylglycine-generating enzyme required for sulfatase activity